VITVAIVLVAGVAGVFGVRAYVDRQYYVGQQAGSVAIYQGVPDQLLWFNLSSVTENTDIKVDDLPGLYRSRVQNTISVDSLDSARATVAELRDGADHCIALRTRAAQSPAPRPGTPGASGSPSPGASGSPAGSSGSSTPRTSVSPGASHSPGSSASAPASASTPGTTTSPTSGASLPKVTEDDCS
jgi:protein phosphatase